MVVHVVGAHGRMARTISYGISSFGLAETVGLEKIYLLLMKKVSCKM